MFTPYTQPFPPAAREQFLASLRGLLEPRAEVLFALVFGSFLSGFPFRDVDVAVFIDPDRLSARKAPDLQETLVAFGVVNHQWQPLHPAIQRRLRQRRPLALK